MTDDEVPAAPTVGFVGARGGVVAQPDAEHRTRWTLVEDRVAFARAAQDLAPALRDRIAAVVHDLRGPAHRPVAAVRWIDDDWVLLLTPTAWFTEDDRQVHTGELGCLVGPDRVLTFEEGDAGVQEHALERLGGPGGHHGTAPHRVVLAVVLSLVGVAAKVEVALGDAVADAERLVFDTGTTAPVQQVYDLKREIAEARRALVPVSAELPELSEADEEHPLVERRTLERLVAAVERVDRHLDAHDDLLSDMLQVHLAQVSVRQNEDMRKISAWAAILVYPTVIAGVYGMNFRHLPELHWVLGYPFSLALMVVGCVVLYRVFRRVGWL